MTSKEKSIRIPKTLEQKLKDLDAHLFLLRMHVEGLQHSCSHLKAIAAELRTLVCLSSGTEGLLHRLVEELRVDDTVNLHLPGNFDIEHPVVKSMQFGFAPLWRAGYGPFEIKPAKFSLRVLIKEIDAVLANGRPLTHEYLIKAVAQQMGTAHEGEALEPALVELNGYIVNDIDPITKILSFDALLSLEIGERILEEAEKKGLYHRQVHDHDFGNLSIVIRLKILENLSSRRLIYTFKSYGADSLIEFFISPENAEFSVSKHSDRAENILIPYSLETLTDRDLVVVFSYCSKIAQYRTLTQFGVVEKKKCKLGWIHSSDTEVSVESDNVEAIDLGFLLIYRRLLSSSEVVELYELPSDGSGLWRPTEELDATGPFPE